MATLVEKLLETYEALSESDQHEAAVEILRRASAAEDGDLPDDTMTQLADELFLMLDAEEANHASS